VLEGRHGGLVAQVTKLWGRRMGHVCCMGMTMGLSLVSFVFFCKPVDVVEGISLRAGYSIPKWLYFPESMWGVVFTACIVFLFGCNVFCPYLSPYPTCLRSPILIKMKLSENLVPLPLCLTKYLSQAIANVWVCMPLHTL